MSNNSQVKLIGLDSLKRHFLNQNWTSKKIIRQFQSAMKKGGVTARRDARNLIRSSPGIKPSALKEASKTWGWKPYFKGRQFGIKLTPRFNIGKYFTEGVYSTRGGGKQKLDFAYIVNFWGKKLNLSNRFNYDKAGKEMEEKQWQIIAKMWEKGQLK